MNNAFPWLGSKARLSKWIIPMLSNAPKYCELFGGSASILLRKVPSQVEIFNDINNGISTFFSIIRDSNKLKELQLKLSLTPYNESDFNTFKRNWYKQENDVEKAFQWYYVAQLSFSGIWGKGPRIALSSNGAVKTYLSSIENLELIHDRFKHVQVLNRDWQEVIEMINNKGFCVYIDPPYVPSTRKDGEYPDEMIASEHYKLVDRLIKFKGKVLLSGYGNKIYNKFLKNKWRKLNKGVTIACSHKVGQRNFTKNKRTESVYLNY